MIALVKKQHEKALEILRENREKLDELAKFLYEKETITGEEFMQILNASTELFTAMPLTETPACGNLYSVVNESLRAAQATIREKSTI